MTYHPLTSDTGGTANDRSAEAQRLVDMLAACQDSMTDKERSFVESMDGCTSCSPKQLFWLRDIKDKYL